MAPEQTQDVLLLSDIVGRAVRTEQGERVGRLYDLVVDVQGSDPPAVAGLVIKRGSRKLFLPFDKDTRLDSRGRVVVAAAPALAAFSRRPRQVLLGHDVMDSQVVDVLGTRVVRVNDVYLAGSTGTWYLDGVEIGVRALLRRLLPVWLRPGDGHDQVLSWQEFELLSSEVPGEILPPDHTRLARLHPADIARVADAMPARQATEVIAFLHDDLAADTLEEMIDEKQADVVESLQPERAAHILASMAPDAAADVLAELEPEMVGAVLQLMSPQDAADVHALLTYPKDTAGGLMTTDYVFIPRGLSVQETLTYLKPRIAQPDWVYYVYVVEDERERRLAGVFSLRDLLLARQDARVDELMSSVPRRVTPDTPAAEVARIISEYNVMALPVVDHGDRLLGIVSVDDALEVILPERLRRSVPRVFS